MIKQTVRTLRKKFWYGLYGLALKRSNRDGRVAVTCAGKDDGGGAQIHARLSVLAFARQYGLEYVHTPFTSLQHGGELEKREWARKWESYFNMERLAARTSSGLSMKSYEDPLKLLREAPHLKENTVAAIPHCHNFTDIYPEKLEWLREPLRECVQSGRDLDQRYLETGVYLVAIHVRRGDVRLSDPETRMRYTSDAYLKQVMEHIRERNPQRNCRFLLFTEGRPLDLVQLESASCRLIDEPDVFVAFDHWLQADAFVMAKSSLSYVAALMCRGTVYYEPFWHPPQADWEDC